MAIPGIRSGMQPGMDPASDPNIDLEGQIREGVMAFVQSQDPAIAVEVCNMLAQMMGIAPEIDPFASEAPAAPSIEGGVPMARRGTRLRMYRRGGIISKYRKGGEGPTSSKGGEGSASSKRGGPASPRGLANHFVDPKDTTERQVNPVIPNDLQVDIFGKVTDQSMRQPATTLPDGLVIPGGYTLEDLGLAGRRGSPLTQELINYKFALKKQNEATIKNSPGSYIRTRNSIPQGILK